MAVTDTHFVEIDATANNDIALTKHHAHTFTAQKIQVPPAAFGAMITIGQGVYSRTWTFTDVTLTRAQHDALIALAITETTTASTYPRLNVMDAEGSPNTWDVFTVDLDVLTDRNLHADEADNRIATLTFSLRQTSGAFTMVVDSGGGNAATVTLDGLESVQQAIGFLAADTVTRNGAPSILGASPLEASMSGWVATGDIDKLQKTLDAELAVEMVGASFKTTGSGYFATEVPSGATAFLTSMTVDAELGALAHVSLTMVHDRG